MKATKFDAERKAAYVLAYERTGELASAAASVGISRVTVYKHLRNDPDFADDVERADGRLDELMMAQVKRLAIEGIEEPVFNAKGVQVGTKRRFSERVLLAWLKRRRPHEWGDRVQVDQRVTGSVEHTTKPMDIPREARDLLRQGLRALPDEPCAN